MLNTKLIKRDEGVQTKRLDNKIIQLLFKSGLMEGILIELEPMTGFDGKYKHKGEEVHVVLEGEVEFVVGSETFHCQEGDILWHRSDLEHTIRNTGMSHAKYITILTPPSLI